MKYTTQRVGECVGEKPKTQSNSARTSRSLSSFRTEVLTKPSTHVREIHVCALNLNFSAFPPRTPPSHPPPFAPLSLQRCPLHSAVTA